MNNNTIAMLCLLSAISGGTLVRHFWAKTETVTVEHETVVDRVVTVSKETVKPDGTKIIVSTRTDNSVSHKDAVVHQEDTKAVRPDWRISGGYDVKHNYYGMIDKRILGPVSVGVSARSDGVLGIHLGIEF